MSKIDQALPASRGCSKAKAEGALLALAAGDALGWPQEMPSRSLERKAAVASTEFQRWVRKSGGRFYPHQEAILAGEYSDDTQLTLAVARCRLLAPPGWWLAWTRTELPLWLLYERGGGGATRRAAESWLRGFAPWKDSDIAAVRRYLEAGGNGVAMRVLPHAIFFSSEEDPENLLHDVVLDGAATHGHPRALIGANVYAFAAWWLLRVRHTLRYGELVEVLLAQSEVWGRLPGSTAPRNGWLDVCNHHIAGGYERLWNQIVDEMRALLERVRRGIVEGALADDQEILRDLGCYSQDKGSGTISAAAAIYLCAQYAAQPTHGVLRAAFATGADTDTVAAMTGGLLGCLSGTDWLPTGWLDVQDSDYLRKLANRLADGSIAIRERPAELRQVSPKDLEAISRRLFDGQPGEFDLDGVRSARVSRASSVSAASKNTAVHGWQIQTSDGQTLYITRHTRKPKEPSPLAEVPARDALDKLPSDSEPPINVPKHARKLKEPPIHTKVPTRDAHGELPSGAVPPAENPKAIAVGVQLIVPDVRRTAVFYENVLGLRPVARTEDSVSYGFLSLVKAGPVEQPLAGEQGPLALGDHYCIEILVADLKTVRTLLQQAESAFAEDEGAIDTHSRMLHCWDPAGNKIKVISSSVESAIGPAG